MFGSTTLQVPCYFPDVKQDVIVDEHRFEVVYMAIVGPFPFNSFLSGVLSCIGTAVLAVCLRIQVNKENKEFKDLAPERAFADFVLCNLVLRSVIMNFLG
ncbi:dolichyl-diphosphooligosaccharide--protein glycosyltransferase subunit DAD1 [Pyrus x bretschneideri]|uniref:dolichyl-diphosphooligosaccharide--protein glycosyltransferase subunit DAD1 n=1 Tax=Pyrus x bretschneideri TaxID=225117 RepID=UPI00202EC6F0|nr:dolichyl-diphosphooligosaccharide--protein glycosyltransferase subunit DAD1 [Pyrus x bretschneideri]